MNMENNQTQISETRYLKRVAGWIAAAYVLCVVLLYFLAGDALKIRNSRGNIDSPAPQVGVIEMVAGTIVTQTFSTQVQLMDSFSILWSTSYRNNEGFIEVSLINQETGETIFSQNLDVSQCQEAESITFHLEPAGAELYGVPLMLQLRGLDGVNGTSVAPLINQDTTSPEGWALQVNGKKSEGVLCLGVQGRDRIWTGLHYWQLAAVGAVFLALGMIWCAQVYRLGKKNQLINAILSLRRYRFLIQQLVARDFKTKYKRSILGVLWSFLNPLLLMSVQYFVFSSILKSNMENYHIYLLAGVVMYNFFSEACGMTLMSIMGNAGLITKVYIPKYIYPLSRVLSSGINLVISLIPLILAALLTGIMPTKAILLIVFPLLCLMIFSLGLGMILCSSMVFFRDTQFLWNVVIMMWMYATPIFYTKDIFPLKYQFILDLNPLSHYMDFVRSCIMQGVSPEPAEYIICMLSAVLMLAVGSLIFKKTQDRFILYI